MRHPHPGSFRDHATFLRRQFLQDGDLPFTTVLTDDVIAEALATLGGWLDRVFRPRGVVFDGWYSSLDNLKLVRHCGWTWLTRLKANRTVRIGHGEATGLGVQPIAASGTVVWLPGYGLVKVFRVVAPDGDTTHWATSDLGMTDLTRVQLAEFSWAVEIDQADRPSRRGWVCGGRIGYHRRDGATRAGRMVPATARRRHRRSRMPDPTRRPAPPAPDADTTAEDQPAAGVGALAGRPTEATARPARPTPRTPPRGSKPQGGRP